MCGRLRGCSQQDVLAVPRLEPLESKTGGQHRPGGLGNSEVILWPFENPGLATKPDFRNRAFEHGPVAELNLSASQNRDSISAKLKGPRVFSGVPCLVSP